ncbi:hypothetical protein JQX13_14005 [Archangium violaceum]|uniref:hypothetical protein n=1 Tax=Archangium violaceum TaxID=83451 RepID=UPI00193BF5BA|nr:hypothetical protein [Archangium violaceum]QRK11080.1 hypothetical protein JQX13_14005 [Archangium violaceum]
MNAGQKLGPEANGRERRFLSLRRTAIVCGVLLTTGLAAAYTLWPERPSGNPLEHYTLEPSARFGFTGLVEERLRAGSYLYLRVRDPAGAQHWVATLSSTASAADAVQVRIFARSEDFHSKRLGRDFSPLLFGTVRSAAPATR